MKVLQINNCHWLRGGSEAVYYNTASLLKEYGHEVVFMSLYDKRNIHTTEPEYFVENKSGIKKIKNYFSNKEAARILEELIIKEKPDIAHAHLFWGGISPSIFNVLKKHGIPLVHTAHDYRMVCPAYLLKDGTGKFCERCKGGKFFNCALHRCSKGSTIESVVMTIEMYYRNFKWHPAKQIDGIIFVSNFSKNKHIEFDKQFAVARTLVLYNCPGENVNKSLDLAKDTYNSYYLFYGRLSEEKGVPTLLRAFEKFPQLRLKIVGSGPLEEELKSFCSKHDIQNIEFLGYKSGKELYDLVADAKYVCVPSECYENNPMTIVEAYSLGTPIIGAAIGGISEIVMDGKTGYLFDSGNIESLIDTIDRAMVLGRDEYERIKNASFGFAEENFSRKKHLERLIHFYQDVLKH